MSLSVLPHTRRLTWSTCSNVSHRYWYTSTEIPSIRRLLPTRTRDTSFFHASYSARQSCSYSRPTQAAKRATGAPQAYSFRLRRGFGFASASIISPVTSIVNHFVTTTYKHRSRTCCPMHLLVFAFISCCATQAYNQDKSVSFLHVSKMILLAPVLLTTSDRDSQKCR